MDSGPKVAVDLEDAVALGADDASFFNEYFFPKTFPGRTPQFHRAMDDIFDAPGRLKAIKAFRGSAKTSKFRAYAARRTAYGFSPLNLVVSESEGHSIQTLDWLKRQVERNTRFASAFRLRPGPKWAQEEIEILNDTTGTSHKFIALGISGQLRGYNFDDARPHTILLDDPLNEENTATPQQREKHQDLIMGALVNGLAAPGVAPDAQLIFGQTPLHAEDAIEVACKSAGWTSGSFGVFDERGESRWPELFPTAYLQQLKAEAISRNELNIWLREMEVKLVSAESAAFHRAWLDLTPALPDEGFTFLCIDPTPPPKSDGVGRVLYRKRLDDFVIMAVKVYREDIFVAEIQKFKAPSTTQWLSTFFEMALRWNPLWIAIETILFARVLEHVLREEMTRTGMFYPILPIEDRRSKQDRIRQALTRRASHRKLHCHPAMTEFIEQFCSWPDSAYDDMLDALSIGLTALNPALEGASVGHQVAHAARPAIAVDRSKWRSAP